MGNDVELTSNTDPKLTEKEATKKYFDFKLKQFHRSHAEGLPP